jgi:hypothetical protein
MVSFTFRPPYCRGKIGHAPEPIDSAVKRNILAPAEIRASAAQSVPGNKVLKKMYLNVRWYNEE